MKHLILLFILFYFVAPANAAELPIAVNSKIIGAGFVTHHNKKTKITKQQLYYTGDVIEFTKAEITLLLRNNKYILLAVAGKYKVTDLLISSSAKPTGLTEQYFKDVWHHTFDGHNSKGLSESEIGSIYGAGKRGGCEILIGPLNNLHTDTNILHFKWAKVEDAKKYSFKILEFSRQKAVLFEREIQDTSFEFNTNNISWENGQQFLWTVEPIDTESPCTQGFNSFSLFTKEGKELEINRIKNDIMNANGDLIYDLELTDALGKQGWFMNAASILVFNK